MLGVDITAILESGRFANMTLLSSFTFCNACNDQMVREYNVVNEKKIDCVPTLLCHRLRLFTMMYASPVARQEHPDCGDHLCSLGPKVSCFQDRSH